MSQRTSKSDIEAVAGIIYSWPSFDGESIAASAAATNAEVGWTFERSRAGGGFVRIEDVVLDEAELAAAVALAEKWRREVDGIDPDEVFDEDGSVTPLQQEQEHAENRAEFAALGCETCAAIIAGTCADDEPDEPRLI